MAPRSLFGFAEPIDAADYADQRFHLARYRLARLASLNGLFECWRVRKRRQSMSAACSEKLMRERLQAGQIVVFQKAGHLADPAGKRGSKYAF